MKKIAILLLLFGCNSFAQVEFVTDVIVHGVKVNEKMVFMNYSEKVKNFGFLMALPLERTF